MSRNRLARSSFVGACCVLLFLMAGTRAEADDLLVTTVADSGAGSLREAMTNHASGDRIVFEIPGTPTIILLSDLPIVAGDISFANNNPTPVTIDRNGNGSLNFEGALVNPTVLVIGTGGGASPDTDITTKIRLMLMTPSTSQRRSKASGCDCRTVVGAVIGHLPW